MTKIFTDGQGLVTAVGSGPAPHATTTVPDPVNIETGQLLATWFVPYFAVT